MKSTSKSLLVMFLCLSAWVLQADPLDHWHYRNPLPTGNSLYGVTFGAGKFVAVGKTGTVLTSADGVAWVSQPYITDKTLNAVTYGNGLFVAVGTDGFIQTSSDATNWTAHAAATTNVFKAVTYGNGLFVAVGDRATLLTSSNGVDWTPRSVPVDAGSTIGDVCFGNGTYVAVSQYVLTSTDGILWTSSGFQGSFNLSSKIAFGNGRFVLSFVQDYNEGPYHYGYGSVDGSNWTQVCSLGWGGLDAPLVVYGDKGFLLTACPQNAMSGNGINWTNVSPGLGYDGNGPSPIAVAFGSGRYVAVGVYGDPYPYYLTQGGGAIFTSDDGANWLPRSYGQRSTLTGIAYGNGVYLGVGDGLMLRSNDGLAFNLVQTPFGNTFFWDVIFSGGEFTAVGNGGVVMQSADGLSWTQRNSGTLSILNRIAVGNGLLIAVGSHGRIQTSPNGHVWTGRWSGTDQPLAGVAYGNGLFVTVGYQGTVLTSPDTVFWTAQDSGQLNDLSGIAYGGDGFVAVGKAGTVATSPDGFTWTIQNSGTTNDLISISYGNGHYVAVGSPFSFANQEQARSVGRNNPILATSQDGQTWTLRNSGNTEWGYIGSTFVNNRFMAVGWQGTITDSDPIPTIPFSLTAKPTMGGILVTVFSPPGPSFRLQASPELSPGGWVDVASFTNVSGFAQWTDTSGQPHRLYRAVAP